MILPEAPVDILVDTMSLGRDRQGGNTGTGVTMGTFIFTAGTVNVNTLDVGNQYFTHYWQFKSNGRDNEYKWFNRHSCSQHVTRPG